VFLYDPNARVLDLRAAVRETWLSRLQHTSSARKDCKGLCATCGNQFERKHLQLHTNQN